MSTEKAPVDTQDTISAKADTPADAGTGGAAPRKPDAGSTDSAGQPAAAGAASSTAGAAADSGPRSSDKPGSRFHMDMAPGSAASDSGDTPQAQASDDGAEGASQAAEGQTQTVDLKQWQRAAEAATEEERGTTGEKPAAGRAEKFFRGLCRVAPVILLLLLAAQVWPELWQGWQGTALYCPPEARQIQIYQSTVQSGEFLVPGAQLPPAQVLQQAQWPGFQWLLLGLGKFVPLGLLFPLAAALTGAFAVLAVWGLSRAAGLGREAAFAAGLVLLCSPGFVPLAHFTGPAALASAFTVLSLLCFLRGWQADRAMLCLPLGFVLAALAGLTGGLLFMALPLLVSFLFLVWRGTFRRGQAGDAMLGFVLLLLLLAVWYGSMLFFTDADFYIKGLFASLSQWQLPLVPGWWKALVIALAGLLPWLLVPLCVAWTHVLRTGWADFKAARHEKAGVAFLWISLLVLVALGVFLPLSQAASLAALMACVAAPLLAKALLNLCALGSRLFYIIVALLLLHAGMALAAAGFGFTLDWMIQLFSWQVSPEQRDMLLSLTGLPVLGLLCLLAAVCYTRLVRRDCPAGALLISALLVVLLAQPSLLLLAPELGTVHQAQLVRMDQVAMPLAAPLDGEGTAPAPQTEQGAANSAAALPAQAPAAEPATTQAAEPGQTDVPASGSEQLPAPAPASDAASSPASGAASGEATAPAAASAPAVNGSAASPADKTAPQQAPAQTQSGSTAAPTAAEPSVAVPPAPAEKAAPVQVEGIPPVQSVSPGQALSPEPAGSPAAAPAPVPAPPVQAPSAP